MQFSRFLTVATLLELSIAGYNLQDAYNVDNFFDYFDFFIGPDPTQGYVNYVDQSTAQGEGFINTNNGAAYVGVDYTNVASGSGRSSVRLTSKNSYTHGLVILDLAHMPGGICGTWPAFWMVGGPEPWPANGEIDIIEGVNDNAQNIMTLHTANGCSVVQQPSLASTEITGNCYVNAPGQSQNQGCSMEANSQATFGAQFNTNGGGVYAMEWTSDGISIWFWPQGQQPSDTSSANPDPSSWGNPTTLFSGCAIDSFFNNQNIVFDTTFCGAWAGQAWSASSCGSLAPTCEEYVQNNPSVFQGAYWSVKSLQVFQDDGTTEVEPDSSTQSTTTAAASVSVPIASTLSVPSTPSTPATVSIPTPTGPTPASTITTLITHTKTHHSHLTVSDGPVTIQPTVTVTEATYIAPPVTQNENAVTIQPTVTVTDVLDTGEFGGSAVGIPTRAPGEQKVKGDASRGHLHRHLRHFKPRP